MPTNPKPKPKPKPENPAPEPEAPDALDEVFPDGPLTDAPAVDDPEAYAALDARYRRIEGEAPTIEEALRPVYEQLHNITHLIIMEREGRSATSLPFELSEKTDELFPALLAFHKDCAGVVEKDSVNPFFSSSYASRAQVKKITHAAMMKAGLFVMNSRQVLGFHEQEVWDKDKDVWRKLTCCRMNQVQRITHAPTGQYVQTSMLMDSHGTSPQAMGTVDSYGARYNSVALLDLAAEDDDGNTGSARASGGRQTAGQRARGGGRGGKKKPPASDAVKKARAELMEEIKDRIEEAGLLGEIQPSKILKEITSFKREGKDDFPGYDDPENITSKGMVDASARRLKDHGKVGDDACGRSA